jgi:hypothetical protein
MILGDCMIRVCVAGLALLAAFYVTDPALAQKKSGGSLAAIQFECFKAQGAYYDASTKRWRMEGTDVDIIQRTDAVNRCVTEKTGRPAGQFLKQETYYK